VYGQRSCCSSWFLQSVLDAVAPITGSRLSSAAPAVGATNSCPTARASGPRRPGVFIGRHRAGRSSFHRCAHRHVRRRSRAGATHPAIEQDASPKLANATAYSGRSTPLSGNSIAHAKKRLRLARIETGCAAPSCCSRARSRVPVRVARGSTTPWKPNSFRPAGNRRPRHRITTMIRRSRAPHPQPKSGSARLRASASMPRWMLSCTSQYFCST
jgi:hypothetical protein